MNDQSQEDPIKLILWKNGNMQEYRVNTPESVFDLLNRSEYKSNQLNTLASKYELLSQQGNELISSIEEDIASYRSYLQPIPSGDALEQLQLQSQPNSQISIIKSNENLNQKVQDLLEMCTWTNIHIKESQKLNAGKGLDEMDKGSKSNAYFLKNLNLSNPVKKNAKKPLLSKRVKNFIQQEKKHTFWSPDNRQPYGKKIK